LPLDGWRGTGQFNLVKGDLSYYYILSACCVIVPAKLMRFPRVKASGRGFCHCVSRVVEGRFIFQTSGHGSAEAERFVQLMRCLEAFSGIRVLTYVLMSNHFHLLLSSLFACVLHGFAPRLRLLFLPPSTRSEVCFSK
jgi:hypothetical protein